MLEQTSSMELDESRLNQSLAHSGGSVSAISAEEEAEITQPPGPDDSDWPALPSTPEKPPTNRQRRTIPEDGPNTALQEEM